MNTTQNARNGTEHYYFTEQADTHLHQTDMVSETVTTVLQITAEYITANEERADNFPQAVYIAVPLTITGMIAVIVLSSVLILRRRRLRGKSVISSYYSNTTIGDGRYNRTNESTQSLAVTKTNNKYSLDSLYGFGRSRERNADNTVHIEEVVSDTGYCEISLLESETPIEMYDQVHLKPTGQSPFCANYSHINTNGISFNKEVTDSNSGNNIDHESSSTLWIDTYDILQTQSGTSTTKTITFANGQCNSQYDHINADSRNPKAKDKHEDSCRITMSSDTDVLGSQKGQVETKQSTDDEEGSMTNVNETQMREHDCDNRISRRYVVLESDGFYFAREEES